MLIQQGIKKATAQFQATGSFSDRHEPSQFERHDVTPSPLKEQTRLKSSLTTARSTLSISSSVAGHIGSRIVTMANAFISSPVAVINTGASTVLNWVAPFVIPIASTALLAKKQKEELSKVEANVKGMWEYIDLFKCGETAHNLTPKAYAAIADLEKKHLTESRKSYFAPFTKNLLSAGIITSSAMALAPQLVIGYLALTAAGMVALRWHSSCEASQAAKLKDIRELFKAEMEKREELYNEQQNENHNQKAFSKRSAIQILLDDIGELVKQIDEHNERFAIVQVDLVRMSIQLKKLKEEIGETHAATREILTDLQAINADFCARNNALSSDLAPKTPLWVTLPNTKKNRKKHQRVKRNRRAKLENLAHSQPNNNTTTDARPEVPGDNTEIHRANPVGRGLKGAYNWTLGFVLPNFR